MKFITKPKKDCVIIQCKTKEKVKICAKVKCVQFQELPEGVKSFTMSLSYFLNLNTMSLWMFSVTVDSGHWKNKTHIFDIFSCIL